MRKIIFLSLAVLTGFALQAQSLEFEKYFTDRTMRVDYYHSGTASEEIFSLDQVYQSQPWAGSRTQLIDTLNLGKYLLKVFDLATNQLIYSRGFASIFGEWQTTAEATAGTWRTFHETVRFPFPKRKVQMVIAVRDRYLVFQDRFSTVIDPNSRFVNREQRDPGFKVWDVFVNGEADKHVDLLLLGDGYTRADLEKFHQDVRKYVEVLFDTEPFRANRDRFNVRAIDVISPESGIDEPRKNIWRHTALECSYNSMDSPRYVLTTANRQLRDIAAAAPYDFLIILVNSPRYGGGGIFQLYATSFTGSSVPGWEWQSEYVIVHEFGHSFAGLGDEYYSSSVAYEEFYPPGVEPWEPNVTALLEPGKVKWQQFVEPGTPLPTPWEKATYDSLAGLRGKLKRDESEEYYRKRDVFLKQQQELLRRQPYWGKVGAFEGSGYSSKGLYRPYLDCRMFSLSLADFCPVCTAAIQRMIDFYSR